MELILLVLITALIGLLAWPQVDAFLSKRWLEREVDYINGDKKRPITPFMRPADMSGWFTPLAERPYLNPDKPYPMRTPRGTVFDSGQLRASLREA